MTGWAAVVYVCGILAAEALLALFILALDATREHGRQRVWLNAARLTVVAPRLVAQAVEDLLPVVEHVTSVDELPHNTLVEMVLANEESAVDRAAELEELRTDAVSVIAKKIVERDAEHVEAIRQTKAKRRHWSTVKRLKRSAS